MASICRKIVLSRNRRYEISDRHHSRLYAASRLPVSKLALGTMFFGDGISFNEACDQMSVAFDNGVNLFDTAEMYPVPKKAETQGLSEIYIGKWLKQKPRDKVFISTKVTGPSGVMTWIRNGPERLDGRSIRTAVEESLIRLDTDYIDIYSLHWPDRYVPMFGRTDYDSTYAIQYVPFEEQYASLVDCVDDGKVGRIGLSNETAFGLMSLQNAYSLLNRTFDTSLAECCYEEDIGLHAYAPLAAGLLTGKYRQGQPPKSRFDRLAGQYPEMTSRYQSKPSIHKAVEEYSDLAETVGISLTEMAIRFVAHHPLIETVLFGASTKQQLQDNLTYASLSPLGDELVSRINIIHDRWPNPAP